MKDRKIGMFTKTICLVFSLFLTESLWDGYCAYASDYPSHPISMAIPFAPGGTTDVVARALAEAMEKHLKQPVVVLSKPGGGTTIAGNFVASAKPDGYTIGFLLPATYAPDLLVGLNVKVPYSSNDLKPICATLDVPMGILVKGDAPWNSLKDMMEYTRQNPGIKIANLGKNTTGYYQLILMARKEKINFVGVPYDGASKMVPAILGGHVSAAVTGMDPTIKSLLDAGKLKILATTHNKRINILPDVPCFGELGHKNPFFPTLGLYGPKGTPEEVVKRIDEVVRKVAEEPEFKKKVYNSTAQLTYLDTATYEKALAEYREFLQAFLKEEGFLK